MELLASVLATALTASTPLLLAALGEHVTERAGVLNLGVEGMMIVGAACGFAAAVLTGSGLAGLAGGALAGLLMAGLFAMLAIGLATDQVATGLALTLFGLGVSGLIGAPFIGTPQPPFGVIAVPLLSELPVLGRAFFVHDGVVFGVFGGAIAIAFMLARTAIGLRLRAIGENQTSAHALGLPVRRMRILAVLFGGLCAGLAGAYLSLIYTRFWAPGMTAGRGWIALALVVFAAGAVWRLVLGALLFGGITVAQLHAQAGAIGLPSQFLSMLPYVITIVALIVLPPAMRRAGGAGSLGQPFVPDR